MPLTINPILREGISQSPLNSEPNLEKNLASSVLSTMGIYGGLIETANQIESSPSIPPSPSSPILNTNILGGLFGVSVPPVVENYVSSPPINPIEKMTQIQMMEPIIVPPSLQTSQLPGTTPQMNNPPVPSSSPVMESQNIQPSASVPTTPPQPSDNMTPNNDQSTQTNMSPPPVMQASNDLSGISSGMIGGFNKLSSQISSVDSSISQILTRLRYLEDGDSLSFK